MDLSDGSDVEGDADLDENALLESDEEESVSTTRSGQRGLAHVGLDVSNEEEGENDVLDLLGYGDGELEFEEEGNVESVRPVRLRTSTISQDPVVEQDNTSNYQHQMPENYELDERDDDEDDEDGRNTRARFKSERKADTLSHQHQSSMGNPIQIVGGHGGGGGDSNNRQNNRGHVPRQQSKNPLLGNKPNFTRPRGPRMNGPPVVQFQGRIFTDFDKTGINNPAPQFREPGPPLSLCDGIQRPNLNFRPRHQRLQQRNFRPHMRPRVNLPPFQNNFERVPFQPPPQFQGMHASGSPHIQPHLPFMPPPPAHQSFRFEGHPQMFMEQGMRPEIPHLQLNPFSGLQMQPIQQSSGFQGPILVPPQPMPLIGPIDINTTPNTIPQNQQFFPGQLNQPQFIHPQSQSGWAQTNDPNVMQRPWEHPMNFMPFNSAEIRNNSHYSHPQQSNMSFNQSMHEPYHNNRQPYEHERYHQNTSENDGNRQKEYFSKPSNYDRQENDFSQVEGFPHKRKYEQTTSHRSPEKMSRLNGRLGPDTKKTTVAVPALPVKDEKAEELLKIREEAKKTIGLDDEYIRKLEEQQKLREEILRKKAASRKKTSGNEEQEIKAPKKRPTNVPKPGKCGNASSGRSSIYLNPKTFKGDLSAFQLKTVHAETSTKAVPLIKSTPKPKSTKTVLKIIKNKHGKVLSMSKVKVQVVPKTRRQDQRTSSV